MNLIRHQAAGSAQNTRPAGATPAAEEEIHRAYAADVEVVTLAREEFAALAERHGATGTQIDDIRLLISEAVTNAVRHAYPGGSGRIHTAAAVSAGRVTILVADDGVGPRAEAHSQGAGWGWPLMAAISERFTIRRRSNGGTEVEMQLHIGPDREPESHGRRGSDSSASTPAIPRFSTTR
jgi:anti-sigma regulatory factor (Ser/Thr protein kinase)